MKGFSGWLYERRASRIVLMAGLFPLGLLSIISAAIAVFTAEVKHWREALIDVAGALAILTVVTLMLRDSVLPEVFGAALVWLAATGLGVLTGVYGSMTLAVQVLLMVVVAGIVIFAAAVSDPVGYWEGFIQDFSQQMAEIGVQVAPLDLLLPLTPLMNGAVGAGMVVSSVLALLLGTWWASRAGGPALRPLFTSLRLGIVVGGITLIVGLLSILDVYAEAANLLVVLGTGFSLQGLAVVHWHAAVRSWPALALMPVYIPMLLGPSILVIQLFLLAVVGFLDNWFNLRRRRRAE